MEIVVWYVEHHYPNEFMDKDDIDIEDVCDYLTLIAEKGREKRRYERRKNITEFRFLNKIRKYFDENISEQIYWCMRMEDNYISPYRYLYDE